jgi:hypothetical protein
MSDLAGPVARILLRYVGAALITKAGLSIDLTDPDISAILEFVIGAAMSSGTELWWVLARKYGWSL